MVPRNTRLNFILLCVFIDTMSIGLILPTLPTFIGKFVGTEGTQAQLYGWLVATFGITEFLAMPILGGLSDRFGRRPVLLLSMLGMCCNFLLTARASNLLMLFTGRIIGGISSGNMSVASAYAADMSSNDDRAKAFGRIGAAFSVGFIAGPLIGGALGSLGIRFPFYIAAILSFGNFLYGYFFVPESLDKAKRTAFSFSKSNPINALSRLVTRPETKHLCWAFGLLTFAQLITQTTFPLYAIFRFMWTPRDIGLAMFFIGVSSTLMQTVLLSRLLNKFGERRLALIGILTGGLTFVLFGIANHGWMIYVIILAGVVRFATYPTLQGVVSKATDAGSQGELMGSLEALGSLGVIFSPLIGTKVLAVSAKFYPGDWRMGTIFFLSAALQFAALFLIWRHFRKLKLGKFATSPLPLHADA